LDIRLGTFFTESSDLVPIKVVPKDSEKINYEFISEQINKCNIKIDSGDYTGAITNARTLVETVLVEIRYTIAGIPTTDYHGKLDRLYKEVASLLGLEENKGTTPEPIKQMLRGLSEVVSGLGKVRNKMGDSHPLTYRPTKEYAKLAVNSAYTLSIFLLSTSESKTN
jgi:hypothetical protein